jgi:hypothetical protein
VRLRLFVRSLVIVALLGCVGAAVHAGTHKRAARPTTTRLLRSPDPDGLTREARTTPLGMSNWLTHLPRHPATWDRAARATSSGITFAAPTYPTSNTDTEGAEPSIKVDRTDTHQRIWITAPTGIGARIGVGPPVGGDLVWYSDDNGATWTQAGGPTGTTAVGGGDTDVAPAYGSPVYVTGLTLANVTLAASCDNGGTFATNPVSTAGTIEDRQWLDAYVDHAKPSNPGTPDFLLDIGLSQLLGPQQNPQVVLYQVQSPSPACTPPVGGPPIDTALANCPLQPPTTIDCYQWPGNLAIDESNGDVYVTYNTLGTDSLNGVPSTNDDKIVVAKVAGGASGLAMSATPVVAASNRPDTFDSFTAVAVDKAGNVYVVWNERHPGAGDPALGETASMYAYSTDHGATWSAPIQINSGPKTTTFPWIVAGDAGKIDVVYYGTDATGPSPETVPTNAQWKVYMAQSLNATSATPTFTEDVASPVIHQSFICTSGTGCASGTRDLLDYFQIDVDQDCNANIAYTDNFVHGTDHTYVAFVQQNAGPTICSGPTAVTVSSFRAHRSTTGTRLQWRTASEAQIAGFNVYRGKWRLNQKLILAHGRPSAYTFVDWRNAAAVYRLQVVRRDGSRAWAGAAGT